MIVGCASTGEYDKLISSTSTNSSYAISNIDNSARFVVFDINKEKEKIEIVSVKNSMTNFKNINEFNKENKSKIRACIHVNPSRVCSSKIVPNIYLRNKSKGAVDTIFATIISPLSLVVDGMSAASGEKADFTKSTFVEKIVDEKLVEDMALHIDSILYDKYISAKSTNGLKALLSTFSFPIIQAKEEVRIAKIKEDRIKQNILSFREKGSL